MSIYSKTLRGFMGTSGLDSGTINFVGDYSSSAVDAYIECNQGGDKNEVKCQINKLAIFSYGFGFGSPTPLASAGYGTLPTGLLNGYKLQIERANGSIETLVTTDATLEKIKFNYQLNWLGGLMKLKSDIDDYSIMAVLNFTEDQLKRTQSYEEGGLILSAGDKLIAKGLNDSFTSMSKHHFYVTGITYLSVEPT